MKSIRQHMILTLLIGLTLLFAAASTALYLYTRNAFIRQFDEALQAKLESFAGMCEKERKYGIVVVELEFVDFPLPEFQPSPEAEYYQVWRQDKTVIARSPSLNGGDLPFLDGIGEAPGIQDIPLPDGRRGRAAATWFTPPSDPEENIPVFEADVPGDKYFMVMARSREDLDNTLITLLLGYITLGFLLISGIVLIVRWSVGKGLLPLDRIARETAGIESSDLTHRFPLEGLPDELVPICRRLNELLDRLESAFRRERRFNADIAHELRTPIAELHALAEVALRKDANPEYFDASQTYFRDVLDIAAQMEKLVTTLLALVRSEAHRQTVERKPVDLIDSIKHAWRPYQEEASKRNIAFELNVPARAEIDSDKALLSAILANLFSNAVIHTPDGGSVVCEVAGNEKGLLFSLKNTNDQLEPDDLDRLFEPLWKKDLSRTDTESNGLGLSLVAAYAGLLDLELRAALPEPDLFEISFLVPSSE